MKNIKKYLFLMAVVAVLFGFAACSNDDDDGPDVVAQYEAVLTESAGYNVNTTLTLKCYSNEHFEVYSSALKKIVAEGKYKGDPSTDETIHITFSKHETQPERVNSEGEDLVVREGGNAIYDPIDNVTYRLSGK